MECRLAAKKTGLRRYGWKSLGANPTACIFKFLFVHRKWNPIHNTITSLHVSWRILARNVYGRLLLLWHVNENLRDFFLPYDFHTHPSRFAPLIYIPRTRRRILCHITGVPFERRDSNRLVHKFSPLLPFSFQSLGWVALDICTSGWVLLVHWMLFRISDPFPP